MTMGVSASHGTAIDFYLQVNIVANGQGQTSVFIHVHAEGVQIIFMFWYDEVHTFEDLNYFNSYSLSFRRSEQQLTKFLDRRIRHEWVVDEEISRKTGSKALFCLLPQELTGH